MNIVNTLTLRHLKLNKRRTGITIIGVALSVCMITATATFMTSFLDLMQRVTIEDTGKWHVSYKNVPADKIDIITGDKGVASAVLSQDIGYAPLEGSKNKDKPYIFIKAYDERGYSDFNINLIEGEYPKNSNEVVISSHIADNGKVYYKPGDTLKLDIGERILDSGIKLDQNSGYVNATEEKVGENLTFDHTREYLITGIISRPNTEPYWAPGYTIVTKLDRSEISSGDHTNVYVTYKNVNKSLYDTAIKTAQKAGMSPDHVSYNHNLLRYYLLVSEDWILGTLYSIAAFVIALIMIGSVSLIYNAFAISLSERSRNLGMLASAGATKRQKRNSVFFEGFIIGLIAIPIGVFFGTVGIGLTFVFVSPLVIGMVNSAQKLTLVISLPSILSAILISILTIYISVFIPAKRASKISPVDAVRRVQDIKLTSKTVKTSKLTRKLFGFEAELALKNLKRNSRRYKSTVFSLVLSILLFLSVSSLSMLTRESADVATNNPPYDISLMVTSAATLEEKMEFFAGVGLLEYADEFVTERSRYIYYNADKNLVPDAIKTATIGSSEVTGDTFYINTVIKSIGNETLERYARTVGIPSDVFKDTENLKCIVMNTVDIKASDKYIRTNYLNIKKGDTLDISSPITNDHVFNAKLEIAAIAASTPLGETAVRFPAPFVLYVSDEVFSKLESTVPEAYRNRETPRMYIKSKDPAKLAENIYNYQKQTSISDIHIYNVNESNKNQNRFITFVYVFFYGFVALITAICIANIFNTVSTGITLRKREFGMLQSVGMTPRGFYKMMNYESLFYAIKALIYGLPLSFLVMLLIYNILGNSFEFKFVIPWSSVFIAVVSVFAMVSATMWYSSSKIRKENIIDMLRVENI